MSSCDDWRVNLVHFGSGANSGKVRHDSGQIIRPARAPMASLPFVIASITRPFAI